MSTAGFALENQAGVRKNLTPGQTTFLANVAGLGVQHEGNYSRIESGFFRGVNLDETADEIVGELRFIGTTVNSDYTTIVNFIESAETLYFCYTPEATEYKREVKLSYITKTFRDSTGALVTPICFTCLTPWFTYVSNPQPVSGVYQIPDGAFCVGIRITVPNLPTVSLSVPLPTISVYDGETKIIDCKNNTTLTIAELNSAYVYTNMPSEYKTVTIKYGNKTDVTDGIDFTHMPPFAYITKPFSVEVKRGNTDYPFTVEQFNFVRCA